MKPEEFQKLYARCREALERYLIEATTTLELLSHSQPEKLGLHERSRLQQQRVRENDAHARYQDLRAKLLDAAQSGYERLN